MNDGINEEQARDGGAVLIFLLVIFTSPFWFGLLVYLARSAT